MDEEEGVGLQSAVCGNDIVQFSGVEGKRSDLFLVVKEATAGRNVA